MRREGGLTVPMKKKEYPDNWEWLSRQVRKRNGGRCELCNAPNGAMIYRPEDPLSGDYPWYSPENWDCKGAKLTKIVLTVHHINSDKMDSTERNLISLCQKCHLRLDLVKHMENRKRGK